MRLPIKTVLKWYLLFTSLYLLADGVIHILNLKFTNIADNWSPDLIIFAQYMSQLYGLFGILIALFGIEVSRNLAKYKNFLYISAVWGVVYAGLLVYYALSVNYPVIFKNTPSIYFWIPFYNGYILFEALLLLILSFLIYLYRKNPDKL